MAIETFPQFVQELSSNPASSAAAAYAQQHDPAFNYATNQGGLVNFFTGEDPVAHNEAVANWKREQDTAAKANAEAWKVRFWEADREDHQFRRKLQDYLDAGFSPLAALEGSGNYAGGSSAQVFNAHSQQANPRNRGSVGGLLGSIIGALALIASKGMATSAQAAKTATETAARAEVAEKAAAAKIAAAETGAQAKIDTARIMKFGEDLRKVGDSQTVASAVKSKARKDLLRDVAFTAEDAAEARKLGIAVPDRWIDRVRKK